MSVWKLYSDGGCRPNPGVGAYCAALYKDDELVESVGGYVGESTNNQTEYKAFYAGITLLDEHCEEDSRIEVYLDSQLVLKQVKGEWSVKEESLKKISKKCREAISYYTDISYNWVKSHSGDIGNEYVDSVCTYFIEKSKGTVNLPKEVIPTRIYINCPYSDKDEAKTLGAKWDAKEKKWWITPEDREQFEKWL